MIASILQIICFLLPLLLQWRQDNKQPSYGNDKQQFDQALYGRNTDNLSALFDKLRIPPAAGDGNPGGSDD